MSSTGTSRSSSVKHHPAVDDASPEAIDAELGVRLKLIRQRFGLTQRELARRSGLTNGTVSLIEQGRVSPSVGSLGRLVQSLSMTLAEFFTFDLDQLIEPVFFAADDLVEIGSQQVSLRLVGAGRRRAMQVLHETYPPGADTGDELLSHRGEEAGVVTHGKIWVTVGGETRELNPGDSFYFESRIPHRFQNKGTQECKVVSAASEASL